MAGERHQIYRKRSRKGQVLESGDEAGRLREVSMQEAQQREAARALDDGSVRRLRTSTTHQHGLAAPPPRHPPAGPPAPAPAAAGGRGGQPPLRLGAGAQRGALGVVARERLHGARAGGPSCQRPAPLRGRVRLRRRGPGLAGELVLVRGWDDARRPGLGGARGGGGRADGDDPQHVAAPGAVGQPPAPEGLPRVLRALGTARSVGVHGRHGVEAADETRPARLGRAPRAVRRSRAPQPPPPLSR